MPAEPDDRTSTDEDTVLYDVAHGVATLTLNRPERNNAWTFGMEHRYFELLDRATEDPGVRAIVVTGAGRAFCPGMDMAALGVMSSGGTVTAPRERSRMDRARSVPKPMVAAINGACAGLGLVQALFCDVRFAARGARISTAFTRRGLGAEYGTAWMLPRLVGLEHALDLLLSARVIDADEALALGLVSRVCQADEVLDAAQEYARDLARCCAPRAMAAVRQQVYAALDQDFESSWRDMLAVIKQFGSGPDFAEGVASFVEKRDPAFEPLDPGFVVARAGDRSRPESP